MITKRFENLCTKIRRILDPKRKKSSRQITFNQLNKAEKKNSKKAQNQSQKSTSIQKIVEKPKEFDLRDEYKVELINYF